MEEPAHLANELQKHKMKFRKINRDIAQWSQDIPDCNKTTIV